MLAVAGAGVAPAADYPELKDQFEGQSGSPYENCLFTAERDYDAAVAWDRVVDLPDFELQVMRTWQRHLQQGVIELSRRVYDSKAARWRFASASKACLRAPPVPRRRGLAAAA